jgi:hypothetical protein
MNGLEWGVESLVPCLSSPRNWLRHCRTRLGWAGFVLSLEGHANGWIQYNHPSPFRAEARASPRAKLGPKASSVANTWTVGFFLPEKERTNLKTRKYFHSHAQRQDFSQPWFCARPRICCAQQKTQRRARYQVNVERVNYTTADQCSRYIDVMFEYVRRCSESSTCRPRWGKPRIIIPMSVQKGVELPFNALNRDLKAGGYIMLEREWRTRAAFGA